MLHRFDVHFHASPEGLGGLVVPGVDDATSHMFSFRGCFFGIGSLSDIDSELGLRSGAFEVSKYEAGFSNP